MYHVWSRLLSINVDVTAAKGYNQYTGDMRQNSCFYYFFAGQVSVEYNKTLRYIGRWNSLSFILILRMQKLRAVGKVCVWGFTLLGSKKVYHLRRRQYYSFIKGQHVTVCPSRDLCKRVSLWSYMTDRDQTTSEATCPWLSYYEWLHLELEYSRVAFLFIVLTCANKLLFLNTQFQH